MPERGAALLAGFLWTLGMALIPPYIALLHLNDPAALPDYLGYSLAFVVYLTIGALVASRRPDNPIGWLFCAIGLSNMVWAFAWQYAIYTLITRPSSLPGASVAAWFGSDWVSDLGWALMMTFVLLLFPTGRLPSPRWRPVAWLAAGVILLGWLITAFKPGPVTADGPAIVNPLGLEGGADLLLAAQTLQGFLYLPALAASALSLLVRFRRSRGVERQQLKWFVYAAALLAGLIVAANVWTRVFGEMWGSLALAGVMGSGLPIAAGIAILRYRLYDIDVIIRRTLVYGLLTATLVLVYLAAVVSLQWGLQTFTGQESSLAVVASTLAVAAIASPLRRRIQDTIDRRFYRRRYDAEHTLAAFGARLREEVDLEAMSANLVAVVRETMQPEHVNLWLNPPAQLRGEDAR